MIPSEIRKVEKHEDLLPFCDWFPQHLGGRLRHILYLINMASSPYPRCDIEGSRWIGKNCPDEITRWERAIYTEGYTSKLQTRSIHLPPTPDRTFPMRQQGMVFSPRQVSKTAR
jgi:hypothetical protein